MDIICDHCQTRLNIPDHKIPHGKKSSFLCPKCKQRINIDPASEMEEEGTIPDISKQAFEFFGDNATTALLCPDAGDSSEAVQIVLNNLGYYTTSAQKVKTALASMKYHLFDIIVVYEDFDRQNSGALRIIDYLSKLEMILRRKVFVLLISKKFRTKDDMAAFHANTNLIININNIDDVEKILARSIKEYNQFYSVFNEAMVTAGKA